MELLFEDKRTAEIIDRPIEGAAEAAAKTGTLTGTIQERVKGEKFHEALGPYGIAPSQTA